MILISAFIAILPQILRGTSCGHDFDFHLVSWFDALQNWRAGILYPHWSPNSNYGAGEPRFIFYPPVSWMLGAALGAILPWKAVAMVMTFLFLAGAGLATRALARHVLSDAPATLAGCAALFSGYALFNAYERTDFGELTGGFWIPLLLLLLIRDRNPSASLWRRALDGSATPMALVIAGAWLSNAPLGVMASYLLAAVALILAWLWRSWAPILRSAVAVGLGLGVATFYILPAAVEQRWADMNQILGDAGYKVENNWLFAHHADPALALHDVELYKASVIASIMLAIALGGLLVCWLRGTLRTNSRWWIPLSVIPIFVLFLLLPPSGFLWNLLPKLRFVEFPWRWLVVLQAPMAILFAAAVWTTRTWARILAVCACAALFLFATTWAGLRFFQVCDEEDAVWAMIDTLHSGDGFVGTDEYEPHFADNSQLAGGLPFACLTAAPTTVLGQNSADAGLQWSPDQHSCIATYAAASAPNSVEHLRLDADAPQPGYLILRLRSYPAWQIRLNGQLLHSLPERADGLVAVPVPAGPNRIAADWTTTSDVVLSRILSAVVLLVLGALYVAERRTSRPRLS